ncbi:MAG: cytidylate kinase-like family protein [Syntrophobacteraceae bacterium]|nr:cytidylate kinase-like family protein [Syntrophobacteraceae bacterium]
MAVLTLSRDMGSGGQEIGLLAANSLGYGFLDRERLIARVKEAGHKWDKWSEGMDERTPRAWERYDWTYRAFVAMVQSAMIKEAVSDRALIMGRGGNFLLKGVPFALRVRVVASLEQRIARVSGREGIDEDSARRLIETTDRERAGFLLTVYGKDGKDPADYDLHLDTTLVSIERIAAQLSVSLSEMDRLVDEKAVKELQMRGLAYDIKARLFTGLPFFMPTLDVEFDGEAICVRGVVRLPKERALVVQEAGRVAGKTPLKFELRYRK